MEPRHEDLCVRRRNPGRFTYAILRLRPRDYGRKNGPHPGYAAALPGADAAAYKSCMESIARVPEPPPYRPVAFAPVDVACDAVPGGGFRLRSRTPLAPHDPSLGRMFRAAVEAQADR